MQKPKRFSWKILLVVGVVLLLVLAGASGTLIYYKQKVAKERVESEKNNLQKRIKDLRKQVESLQQEIKLGTAATSLKWQKLGSWWSDVKGTADFPFTFEYPTTWSVAVIEKSSPQPRYWIRVSPAPIIFIGAEIVDKIVIELHKDKSVEQVLNEYGRRMIEKKQSTVNIATAEATRIDGYNAAGMFEPKAFKEIVTVFSYNGKTYSILGTLDPNSTTDFENYNHLIDTFTLLR